MSKKLSTGSVEMIRMMVDTSLNAIKMTTLGNAGAAIGVFGHNAFFKSDLIMGALLFAIGFSLSIICAGVAYLTQWKYSLAAQYFERGDLEEARKLNKSGNKRRLIGMGFWWLSALCFFVGTSIIWYKCS